MGTASTFSVTDEQFETSIRQPGLVVVDFWAEWCGPCRALAPLLEELAGEFGARLHVLKVKVDANPQAASRFGIRGIPTLVFFKDGAPVDQVVGLLPKDQLRARIARHLA